MQNLTVRGDGLKSDHVRIVPGFLIVGLPSLDTFRTFATRSGL